MSYRIGKMLFVVALVLLVLPGSAAAANCADGASDLTQEDVQAVIDAYNANSDALPGFIVGQISGERVELRITGESAVVYTVAFDNRARATSITQGVADPSLRVTTASSTLCDAVKSDNPAVALGSAYQNGDVTIEGVGTANSVKVTLMETAVSIGKLFGLF